MTGQIISEVTFRQMPGIANLQFVAKNKLSFRMNIPLDITNYAFYAAAYNNKGEVVVEFAITVVSASPTGVLRFALTTEQTATLLSFTTPLTWAVDWSPLGDWTDERTFVAGSFLVVRKGSKA